MTNFSEKTIIITGGGRGIGRGISTAFARQGASIIICGRREPDPFPDEIAGQVHFTALDIREDGAAERLIKFAKDKTGRVDVLINNAGGGPPVNAENVSPRFTETIIRLNLTVPFHMSQAAFQAFEDRGSIINISSVSGERASPMTAAYGAAKAGLLSMTKSLAMEWAPKVRVNAIIVGLVKTESSKDHYGGEAGMAHLAAALPMKRMGTPEDIAQACLFLANPASTYVSGACLEVHGGGEPPSFLRIAEEAYALGQDKGEGNNG